MTWLHYLMLGLACLIPPMSGLLVAWAVAWLVWGVLLHADRADWGSIPDYGIERGFPIDGQHLVSISLNATTDADFRRFDSRRLHHVNPTETTT